MNKRITYNRQTKDWDMFIGFEYVGSRATHAEAERDLDEMVYTMLTHGVTA